METKKICEHTTTTSLSIVICPVCGKFGYVGEPEPGFTHGFKEKYENLSELDYVYREGWY